MLCIPRLAFRNDSRPRIARFSAAGPRCSGRWGRLRCRAFAAVCNPGNLPLQWMNINFRVGPATATWGRGGGAVAVLLQFPLRLTRQSMVNMGDDRANAPLDPVPVFQHTTFFRETMHSFPGYLPNRSD